MYEYGCYAALLSFELLHIEGSALYRIAVSVNYALKHRETQGALPLTQKRAGYDKKKEEPVTITADDLYSLQFLSNPVLSPDGTDAVVVLTTIER